MALLGLGGCACERGARSLPRRWRVWMGWNNSRGPMGYGEERDNQDSGGKGSYLGNSVLLTGLPPRRASQMLLGCQSRPPGQPAAPGQQLLLSIPTPQMPSPRDRRSRRPTALLSCPGQHLFLTDSPPFFSYSITHRSCFPKAPLQHARKEMLGDADADAKVTQGRSGRWRTVVTERAPTAQNSSNHCILTSQDRSHHQGPRGGRSILRSPCS